MKLKTYAIAALLAAAALAPAAAAENSPIDLVVAIDTSASMGTRYKEAAEYAVGPLLKEFLRYGDTFHLIGFSSVPRAEISRQIESSGDIETIIGRMLLMYPLDPYTDFVSALEYLNRYVGDLPESRSKIVVIVSDGEHSPPSASPYFGLSEEALTRKIGESTTRLKGNGWLFYYVKVPFSGKDALPKLNASRQANPAAAADEASGSGKQTATSSTGKDAGKSPTAMNQPLSGDSGKGASAANAGTNQSGVDAAPTPAPAAVDVGDNVADGLASSVVEWKPGSGVPNVATTLGAVFAEFPDTVGKKDRRMSIPVKLRNPSDTSLYIETQGVLVDGQNRMSSKSFVELKPNSVERLDLNIELPGYYKLGSAILLLEPQFSGNVRLVPGSAKVKVEITNARLSRFFGNFFPVLVFIIGVIAATVLTLIAIGSYRKYSGAPMRAAVNASGPPSNAPRPGTEIAADARRPDRAAAAALVPAKGTATAQSPAAAVPAGKPAPFAADQGEDLLAAYAKRSREEAGLPVPAKQLVPAAASTATKAAVSAKRPGERPLPVVRAADARIMLSLYVKDQNTAIGRRNVHLMKAGSQRSLGGGRSDFLVFLVKVPNRIADVYFDGEKCSLMLHEDSFFPDYLGIGVIEDCVGKDIRIVSGKGYEMTVRLDRYEDPLSKLNSFLHSIETPGLRY